MNERNRWSIKLSVLDADQDEVQLRIQLTNGTSLASLEFYTHHNEFKGLSKQLLSFPETIGDIITYEIGEDSKTWAYYMCLKIYCYEASGRSVIHAKIKQNGEVPYVSSSEFYIKTFPSYLNNLGELLTKWHPKDGETIEWIAE